MTKKSIWTVERITEGINRFINEERREPTARDFDLSPYLPSARQIQRAYGGVPAFRKLINLENTDYTRGALRKSIATKGYSDGLAAEEALEVLLTRRYGEPYVHTQKRYGEHKKNRYDFFIYHKDGYFAVDIFTTNRPAYIATNVRHKIAKYKELPSSLTVYFVVNGNYTDDDIALAARALPTLKLYPNMHILTVQGLLEAIDHLEPLAIPPGFRSSFGS